MKKINVAGEEIEIRELTVGEIDDVLGTLEKAASTPVHMCDLVFPARTPVDIVCRVTGKSPDFFNRFTPSEYRAVLEAVDRANPSLAAMVVRLAEIGKTLLPRKSSPEPLP